ncbi:MAG: Peptidoglycan glycosyltransferase [Candidatus Moranbacteria bacterium GW2011_GWE1_36_7]|nr:MAG: Peptidoglycan glycosyltransferase [Candidatus Moranbacteria bacterium GW2011_GWD2_36_12]KKQ05970.1 MAG: Peptidoglycan glycosyltransferase [Candidatus Moranbacteria bacterium GW2011_GWE2_36_40]KKQ11848.1 MAG: Peptidoglycan glycosyltransferase [Candidatus Moranbacteria bacterium GW2011_GWE1_36_7]
MNKIKIAKHSMSDRQTSEKNWRINGLAFFILFVALSIIAKLYFLQVIRHGSYVALAENQHSKSRELQAERGEIFLQDENHNYPLAVNRELQMAYAVPKEMKDLPGVVDALSLILGMDRELLKGKLDNPDDMFEILKHKLSDDEVKKIRDAKIAGVYLSPESFRYYPGGELAAQLVGFVGSNGESSKGMYGLEAFWENKLQGKSGMIKQEGDSRGRWIAISDRSVHNAENGPDMILTINHTVQFEVEKILKQVMEKFSADSATIIVQEPKTGKILALANQPTFNPNDFSSTEDISRFTNPAVSEPYESGSVFKAFTEAIGIDDGKITPDTTFVDTGVVQEAGYEIHNSDMKANGLQTMTQVLEKSLNTGVIYIEKLVGNKNFADYVKRFGFGEKTNIDLPGEVPGNTRNLNNPKATINFFTASFGQGISVTPIQLAAGYSALANNGTLMKPQIVDKLLFEDGSEEVMQPQEVRQVISASSAEQMGRMLRAVVLNGHSKRADVPGYLVGGKTGTAQIAKTGSKGYEEGVNVGSFAGYAPIDDPQFVVIVKIVNPRGVEWAESSAAPAFGSVMKFLLEYYKVKPTEDPTISPMYKTYQAGIDPLAVQQQPAQIVQVSPYAGEKEKKKKDEKKENNSRVITSQD